MRRIIDFHCDALYKMLYQGKVDFTEESLLDVTLPRMKQGGVGMQVMALFLERNLLTGPPRFSQMLRAIDLYRENVLLQPNVMPILTKKDVAVWEQDANLQGFILSLEGVDALEGDLVYLRTVHALGVRFVGLCWNYANWAADGAQEPRKGGFTLEGIALIKECEKLGITLDVSHLNEHAFWQLLELTDQPIIASHSNAAHVMPHVRNLTDEQIKAIIARNGRIGITYVPYFTAERETVTIEDLLRHVDHFCQLGGEKHVMLGSDFDGIDQKIKGLEHAGQHGILLEAIEQRYGSAFADNIAVHNAMTFLKQQLPD